MVSVRQIKAARALLGWTQIELAERAGISRPTIERLEAIDGELGGSLETVHKITSALERAGIMFLNDGVRLRPGG